MAAHQMTDILSSFPRSRPALPPAYQEIFERHYQENRAGLSMASCMSQRLESWMHGRVAGDVVHQVARGRTLEIGAGTLNHLPYEKDIKVYDIIEPRQWLFEKSPQLSRVRNVYHDIRSVPGRIKYDRIISVATFEHLQDLPSVVARSGLLLDDGGSLRVGIPSEGTIIWRLAWALTTGLEFRLRYGLSYEVIMRHEHINSAREIRMVLRYFFRSVTGSVLGLLPQLSLYQFMCCADPWLERCRAHLRAG